MKNIIAWLIMGSLLLGCGQSGKLYLPDQTPKSPTTEKHETT